MTGLSFRSQCYGLRIQLTFKYFGLFNPRVHSRVAERHGPLTLLGVGI